MILDVLDDLGLMDSVIDALIADINKKIGE